MNKHKNTKDKEYFSAEEAMNLIDKSYNSHDYPIISKIENAYVMPWSTKNDVDIIDPKSFYDDDDFK
ncbi:MAG: hypothetical protein MJA82_16550 [Clostridia bacterium]|nr:hypothetical protein [Clostridia bacterium]